MKNTLRCAVIVFVAFWGTNTDAAPPTGSDPMTQCHKVFSEVGLLVRASASSSAKKIGSLTKGQKVQLDGESLPETGAVYPMIKKDSEGSYWIKLKAPKAGYVLYSSDSDPNYTYIVPCK